MKDSSQKGYKVIPATTSNSSNLVDSVLGNPSPILGAIITSVVSIATAYIAWRVYKNTKEGTPPELLKFDMWIEIYKKLQNTEGEASTLLEKINIHDNLENYGKAAVWESKVKLLLPQWRKRNIMLKKHFLDSYIRKEESPRVHKIMQFPKISTYTTFIYSLLIFIFALYVFIHAKAEDSNIIDDKPFIRTLTLISLLAFTGIIYIFTEHMYEYILYYAIYKSIIKGSNKIEVNNLNPGEKIILASMGYKDPEIDLLPRRFSDKFLLKLMFFILNTITEALFKFQVIIVLFFGVFIQKLVAYENFPPILVYLPLLIIYLFRIITSCFTYKVNNNK